VVELAVLPIYQESGKDKQVLEELAVTFSVLARESWDKAWTFTTVFLA